MISLTARKSRLVVIPTAGLVAAALVATDMIFMIKDSQSTDLALATFKGSTAGAAVLNAFALTSIVILTFTRTCNTQPRLVCQTISGWIGALIGLASTIITINVLVLKKINPSLVHRANSTMGLSTEVELGVWAVATAAQFVFYILFAFAAPARSRSSRKDAEHPSSSPLATLEKKRAPPSRPEAPSSLSQSLAPPFDSSSGSDAAPQLDPPKFNNNSKRSSWRDSLASLQHIVRPQPAPQQRRLLQQSVDSTARSSLSLSDSKLALSQHLRSETFDSFAWDFSAPETQIRDTIQGPVRKGGLLPVNGTMLPTIPGSRPTSQGQALGDPFEMDRSVTSFASDKSKDSFDVKRPESSASSDKFSLERVRDLSERPTSALSSTSTCTLPDNFPARPETSLSISTPDMPRPPTSTTIVSSASQSRPTTAYSTHSSIRRPAMISRPTTPSVHESNIHPLFRADSPVPPPAVSAGTIITASTFSGQTIGQVAPRPYLPFAPETPPPTIPARSPSRQRAVATPPAVKLDERFDSPRAGTPHSRSATPTQQIGSTQSSPQGTPKRNMAIPDFILSASNERLI